ncbi:hypothetical protein SNE40_023674 [Patella caerulea]|uniref:Uncharacterized protein n=1 Tax=Patella caerulea TaxID=87958 RepID=A0AAN8G366_PATCE
MSLPNPTDKYFKEIERLMFKFIWGKSNDKIKRDQMSQTYDIGGLKMTNIKTFTKCLKLSWIRRWWSQNSLWTLFPDQYFGGIRDILKVGPKYMTELALSTDNPFWKDVILAYHDFPEALLDDNNTEISEQPLWYNYNIKLDLIQNWHNNGVSLISDLISPDGKFYKYQELKDIHKIKGTFLDYQRVMTAIPKSWKKKIAERSEPKMIGPIKPLNS